MRFFLLSCITCMTLLLTGCGVSRQATGNSNLTQTKVVLAGRNYKVVGQVSGHSKQDYWFGVGGLTKKSLGESAMSEMYDNANLTGSQAIININVSYKNKFVLFYSGAEAHATGTVIQFVDDMNEVVTAAPQAKSVDSRVYYSQGSKESEHLDAKRVFVLNFMKKKKNEEVWTVDHQEELYTTLENANDVAEEWNNRQSKTYDYHCNIKPKR